MEGSVRLQEKKWIAKITREGSLRLQEKKWKGR